MMNSPLALTLVAVDKLPIRLRLESALEQARQVWNYDPPFPTEIREEPPNSCSGRAAHDVANAQTIDTWSTLTDEGKEPVTTQAYTVVILINSNCDWGKLNLVGVMAHEYRHILLGAASNSRGKPPIMFRIPGGMQQITAAETKV
jgi:hypothetical protein